MSDSKTPRQAFDDICRANDCEAWHGNQELNRRIVLQALEDAEAKLVPLPSLPAPWDPNGIVTLYEDRKRWIDYARALSMEILALQVTAASIPTVRLCHQDMLAILIAIACRGPLTNASDGPMREAYRLMSFLEEKGILQK